MVIDLRAPGIVDFFVWPGNIGGTQLQDKRTTGIYFELQSAS